MKPILTRDKFIVEWNAAKSIAEFCNKHGYLYSSASSRASGLRRRGYKLQSFIDHEKAGRLGGSKERDTPRPFAANKELASRAGAIGGRISKRGKSN